LNKVIVSDVMDADNYAAVKTTFLLCCLTLNFSLSLILFDYYIWICIMPQASCLIILLCCIIACVASYLDRVACISVYRVLQN